MLISMGFLWDSADNDGDVHGTHQLWRFIAAKTIYNRGKCPLPRDFPVTGCSKQTSSNWSSPTADGGPSVRSCCLKAMKWAENLSNPPGHAMPQQLGTVPHTESINATSISSKIPYQVAIAQRYPTRNQNARYCIHSPLDLYCACQPGHRCQRGVQYLNVWMIQVSLY